MKFKLQKIETIISKPYTGKVFDITVKNKHSYTIKGVVVHNSVCETRIKTGVGIPQFTAIRNIVEAFPTLPIISDGGVQTPGDFCKALAAGAHLVMSGSLFAGTRETPCTIEKTGSWPNQQLFMKYAGSASASNKESNGNEAKHVEGASLLVPYKGKAKRIFYDLQAGLQSAMSYVGVTNMIAFRREAEFIEVSQSGAYEGHPYLTYKLK